MSNRISKEKAQAIAQEYCTNGHKKIQALLEVGYKSSYAKSGLGSKIYDNILVKQAISELEAVTAKKTGFTIEKAQDMYEDAYRMSIACNQPAAMVSATTGIARLYGMDKDAGAKEQVVIVIGPKPDSRPVVASQEVQDGSERPKIEDKG